MKLNQRYIKALIYALCFLLPAIVMLAAFAAYDMAPFGDNSILIMDMSGQYSEFYIGLRNFGKDSNIFFSWSKSLGTNYIGVFAYYLSSPLSFLTLLSSEANMPIFLLFLTVFKIGLCGLTFGIFLSYMYKCTPKVILFSLFYGLMSYNIVYSMCLMWIDGVIWLPIILLGIEELLSKNRIKLLIFSLFAVFISTYYISYMIGIFSCIYFIYRYLVHYSSIYNLKQIIVKFIKFIYAAIVSALLGAWLLLPTLMSLFDGKIGGSNYTPDTNINFELNNLVSKLFLGSYDSITNSGMPFLYTSTLVTILFIGYFFLKNVPVKDKIATLTITVLLLSSMYYTEIDIAWHIFQYPNWFPYRYSFVFLFFTIFIAYKTFVSIKDIPFSYLFSFPILGYIVSMLIQRINYYYVKEENIQLTVKVLFFYSICLILLYALNHLNITDKLKILEKVVHKGVPLFVLLIMLITGCYELYNHSIYMFKGLDRMHFYEKIEPYRLYRKAVNGLLDDATKNEDENSFYRVLTTFARGYNEPISFGYKGIAHYSSAYNRNVNNYLSSLGFSSAHLWCTGYGSTIVTDSIFSVKYLMSIKPETSKYEQLSIRKNVSLYKKPEDKPLYEHPKDMTIYRNPNALSVAFMADSNLVNLKGSSSNHFTAQNNLLKAITGNDNSSCFTKVPFDLYFENATIEESNSNFYKRTGDVGIVRYTTIAKEDMELYAFFPIDYNSQGCSVYVNGKYINELYYGQFNCIHFLGSFKTGDEINVEIKFSTAQLNVGGNIFYSLDYNKFIDIVSELKEGNLNISYYSAGKIKGTVLAKEDGTLFTSIPYDKGWSVYVDGKKQTTLKLADTLLCVNIPEGEHNVVLKFTPVGFIPGITLSSLTLAVIIIIIVRRNIKKKS